MASMGAERRSRVIAEKRSQPGGQPGRDRLSGLNRYFRHVVIGLYDLHEPDFADTKSGTGGFMPETKRYVAPAPPPDTEAKPRNDKVDELLTQIEQSLQRNAWAGAKLLDKQLAV